MAIFLLRPVMYYRTYNGRHRSFVPLVTLGPGNGHDVRLMV